MMLLNQHVIVIMICPTLALLGAPVFRIDWDAHRYLYILINKNPLADY
ncbi:rCG49205, partial [Rattus norvegicus]